MGKVMLFIFGILVSAHAISAKDANWKSSKSTLKFVFVPAKKSENVELIRLYQDKTFEHLVYVPEKSPLKGISESSNEHKSSMQRNCGNYTLINGMLKFSGTTKEFESELYGKQLAFSDNKIYGSKFQSIFQKKDFLLKTASKSKFSMPFYLDPYSNLVVTNAEAAERLDVADLVQFLTKKAKSEESKFQIIKEYITRVVRFSEKEELPFSSNETTNVPYVLAGKSENSSGREYANTLQKMGEIAGLNIQTIYGWRKKQKGFQIQKNAHAWNEWTIGGNRYLYDLALGEKWEKVDPAVMIHSHFPEKESDQLLEKPLSLQEFEVLPTLEPVSAGARFVSFLPAKHTLFVKDKVEIIFEESVSILKVEFAVFDVFMGEFGAAVTITSKIHTDINYGKLKVTIPVTARSGQLTVKTSGGMQLVFLVENTGQEQTEIADYLTNLSVANRPKYHIQAIQAFSNPTKENNAAATIQETWLKSDEPFLQDLSAYDFLSDSLISNPLIQEARKFYGEEEIEGAKHNTAILLFFKESGNANITSDEISWCSVFISYCAKKAGLSYTKKATAKSWLDYGQKIRNPEPGDLVVFWREDPDSWKGHVAIFLSIDPENKEIICLGGNQDGKVCIRQYSEEYVLGFRRLTK